MRKNISIVLSVIIWGTVLTQYYLMLENRVASIAETTIRFFSFFTILTNSLVAIYFTLSSFKPKQADPEMLKKPGTLTAVAAYITMVGLVYQILLRQIWEPTGIHKIVDELLHSIIPIAVIAFWYWYEDHSAVAYRQIPRWLLFPFLYLAFILIRGHFSDFYPYPFVNVEHLGLAKVLLNSSGLIVVFVGISMLFVMIGKAIKNR